MEKVLYKAGYLVQITSWENDGDNDKVCDYHAISEEEARAVVELALLFKSKNRYVGCVGNIYYPTDSERLTVFYMFVEHNKKFPFLIEMDPIDDSEFHSLQEEQMWSIIDKVQDAYFELLYDLGLTGDDFYTRVCDKIQVLHIPQDVVCEDLTEKFKS